MNLLLSDAFLTEVIRIPILGKLVFLDVTNIPTKNGGGSRHSMVDSFSQKTYLKLISKCFKNLVPFSQ